MSREMNVQHTYTGPLPRLCWCLPLRGQFFQETAGILDSGSAEQSSRHMLKPPQPFLIFCFERMIDVKHCPIHPWMGCDEEPDAGSSVFFRNLHANYP